MASDAKPAAPQSGQQRFLVGLVVFLFFAWGFATVLNDTLIPKLKGLFELSYTDVMLTQFSFFLSYFIFSIPAGLLLSRIGYVRGAALGLVVTAAGYGLFTPAAEMGSFGAFLLALFVVAAGITMLQVAANPFIELLGSEETSHSRLTLAQAFNSLGTTIGPSVGAVLILRTGVTVHAAGLTPTALAVLRKTEAHALQLPFFAFALMFLALAALFWFLRKSSAPPVAGQARLGAILSLLGRPRLVLGALAIFVYVGAEVSIGSVMINYLMQPSVLAVTASSIRRDFGEGRTSLVWRQPNRQQSPAVTRNPVPRVRGESVAVESTGLGRLPLWCTGLVQSVFSSGQLRVSVRRRIVHGSMTLST